MGFLQVGEEKIDLFFQICDFLTHFLNSRFPQPEVNIIGLGETSLHAKNCTRKSFSQFEIMASNFPAKIIFAPQNGFPLIFFG